LAEQVRIATSRFGLGLLFFAWSVCAAADSENLFARIERLNTSGATQLALRILDSEQPPVEQIEDWLRAEQLRFAIYRKQEAWDALTGRLDRIPAELPLISQHRVVTHAVESLLQSGVGSASRKYLRDLIWRGSGDSLQVAHWRRLVIRSYLLNDFLVDARIAMARYQKEYAPTDQDWSYLYGLTLLKSGAFEQAAARLSLVQTDRARILMWLARLRAGIDDPGEVINQAEALYAKVNKNDGQQPTVLQRIWSLQAEAAAMAGNMGLRVKALERLFSRPLRADVEFPLEFTPEHLWQAYEELGADAGNRQNLLVGDTESWLRRAAELRSGNMYDARAMYALLALRSRNIEQMDRLHGDFYDLLRGADLEFAGISLYRDPSRFSKIEQIPPSVRHRIVNYAVQKRDLGLAAVMARDLTTTYAGQSPDEWKLVRARLAIYAGELSAGKALLYELIRPQASLQEDTADRILQLVFDLQSVDQHAQALELFQLILARVRSENLQREIHFWIGESLKDLGEYERAAESFIRSAFYAGDDLDMWGQTARYHAAEALAEGGMLEDAQEMYDDLLKVTTDPARAMSLERKIQDLWLRKQGLEKGDN
jgi:tetratricopeptide (TPR) repeat protein